MRPHHPHTIRHTFTKAERLCSRKIIAEIFTSGRAVSAYPFRMAYLEVELPLQEFPAQVMMVVSSKRFKNAVTRNLIKRRMRELYRMNKHKLYDSLDAKGKTMALALFYTGTEPVSLQVMEPAFQKVMQKLRHEIGR